MTCSRGHRLCRTEMGRPRGVQGAIHLALGFVIFGCGSSAPTEAELAYASSMRPTVEMATTATEEAALDRAGALPEGEPVQLADGVVVAGPLYTAASGRRCRELSVGAGRRLACEAHEAEGWVFVPDVFAGAPTTAGDERPSEAPAPDVEEGGDS